MSIPVSFPYEAVRPPATRVFKMPRIAVLDHNQRETDRPRRFLKRSVGQNLVRRALAFWIVKNSVLQMLPPHEIRARSLNSRPRETFAAGYLPPVELPGIFFEDPVKRDRMSLLKQYSTQVPILVEGELELPERQGASQ